MDSLREFCLLALYKQKNAAAVPPFTQLSHSTIFSYVRITEQYQSTWKVWRATGKGFSPFGRIPTMLHTQITPTTAAI